MRCMADFWWGVLVGVAGIVVLAAAALYLDYRLSPEGREDAAILRRLRQDGVRARRKIQQDRWDEVREELRRDGQLP